MVGSQAMLAAEGLDPAKNSASGELLQRDRERGKGIEEVLH